MINIDGQLVADSSFYLNAENSVFARGDGLVETVRVLQGKVIFWEEHYLRLMASMRILRMEIPMNFTMEFLEEELRKTIDQSGLNDKAVIARIYVFPKNSDGPGDPDRLATYLIQLKPLSSPFYLHEDSHYEVDLYKDFYIQAGMLSTLPTVSSVLKSIGTVYALENGYADCILLNDQKNVVQTLKGNLFLVGNNKIKTPPLSDGCDNNVLRKKVIELIEKSKEYEIEEGSISPFELQKADELFITEISSGIQSVSRYRRTEFKNEIAISILGKLNAAARFS
ncbi:aminotransferase class IV [Muriicola marianensis]|uniref:branched-chain-amino-acid transaminase n=1 Tax=Muriicola marianensis TaxID=1324801 RepID=A0ABQ1QTI2_9FLAO|nr:aminotransferase class IV [Muriicola marianensis]GGD40696.1 aminotransferase class IV [Muriicola marianensis]